MALELKKSNILTLTVITVAVILIIRLFNLQVIDKEYKKKEKISFTSYVPMLISPY